MLIGLRSKLSTKYWSTFGDKKAGNDGPKYIPLIPRANSANKSATAFCSYHESIMLRGNEFTLVSKASAKLVAILTAEY